MIEPCLLGDANHWRLAAVDGNEGTYLFAPLGNPARIVHSFASPEGQAIDAGTALHRSWGSMLLAIAPEERTLRMNQHSSFGVISQTSFRAMGDKPGNLLQVRTARYSSPNPGPEIDLVVALDRVEPGSEWGKQILALSRGAGFHPELVGRERVNSGYEKETSPPVLYLDQSFDKRYATLWLRRAATVAQK
jgi:hypothetical protein